jgi:pilus assembly protein Flp/PilA
LPTEESAIVRTKKRGTHAMDALKLFPIRMYLAAKALRDREEGQAMVEYALILSLVSVAAVAVLTLIGGKVSSIFSVINDDL